MPSLPRASAAEVKVLSQMWFPLCSRTTASDTTASSHHTSKIPGYAYSNCSQWATTDLTGKPASYTHYAKGFGRTATTRSTARHAPSGTRINAGSSNQKQLPKVRR